MAVIPRIIPNTVDVHLKYTAGPNQMENVYQFIYEEAPSVAQLLALATDVGTNIGAKQAAFTSGDIVFREVQAIDIGSSTGSEATYTFPNGTTGLRGGSIEPLNVASGITLRTGHRGRSNKGRKSYSGFVESDVDSNTLGSSLMGLLTDLAVELIRDRVSSTYRPAVGSMKLGSSRPITSAVILDNNVDSQKTRLNLHGQ
jgi:hypothetical protein